MNQITEKGPGDPETQGVIFHPNDPRGKLQVEEPEEYYCPVCLDDFLSTDFNNPECPDCGYEIENKEILMNENKELEIQQDNLSPLVKLALGSDIDIGKLEKLIEVQEHFDQNQAKKEFYKAFSNFKKNPLTITKDSTVDFTSSKGRTLYKHASLGNIMSVVGPLLSAEGLALSWIPVQDAKGISVTAVLSHTLGFSIDATLHAPPDTTGNKGGLQALGSTITYLERYTCVSLLGLAMTNDDDGRSACEPSKGQNQKPEQKPPYPDKDFEKNFPAWEKGIKNGGNTAEGIIRIIEKKSSLTTDQKTLIREIK